MVSNPIFKIPSPSPFSLKTSIKCHSSPTIKIPSTSPSKERLSTSLATLIRNSPEPMISLQTNFDIKIQHSFQHSEIFCRLPLKLIQTQFRLYTFQRELKPPGKCFVFLTHQTHFLQIQQQKEANSDKMYRKHSKMESLRSSQRFLSKQHKPNRTFTLCCDDEEISDEDVLIPAYPRSPQPKISIKKLRKQSPFGGNHTNSDFSLSKQSQRSIVPISKKTTQTNIVTCPHCPSEHACRPLVQSYPTNITFLYLNGNQQEKSNHYNVKTHAPLQKGQHTTPASNYAKPKHNFPSIQPKQLNQSIEKQFKNILDFGDNKQTGNYGQPFPLDPQPAKVKPIQNNMSHFSFGQNQKEQFMSKYLNVKQEAVAQRVVISSKQNSKRSQMMKQIIEQRMSKSSKSSGRLFVRGTFNKHNQATLGQRRDLMYKSQSDISGQSSQSLVLQSYQSFMRKREKESSIRDYQY